MVPMHGISRWISRIIRRFRRKIIEQAIVIKDGFRDGFVLYIQYGHRRGEDKRNF